LSEVRCLSMVDWSATNRRRAGLASRHRHCAHREQRGQPGKRDAKAQDATNDHGNPSDEEARAQ